ncbi:MAG: hypothetical protein K8R34_13950 [Methanosarcinales archaeon]|nr:hypothetical protein [Methanosarcinales archaeon]MCD4799586.1 hypothetical protein [Methanosarcinales archaeon]
MRCSISLILYFNSHAIHRQHPTTPEATARTYKSQPTLNACVERKQAGIISIICGSKLARIHKAGCHHAALTGCGGRESADSGVVYRTCGYCESLKENFLWSESPTCKQLKVIK